MATRQRLYGKPGSDAQTLEHDQEHDQEHDHEQVRTDGPCPECEGEVIAEEHEAVCDTCGLVVEERYVRPVAQFQLKNFDDETDKRGLETETPYMLDPHGSPYRNAPLGVTFPTSRRDWRFDANENRLNGAYKKWDDIRYRQIRHTTDSTNNARTDALQDIKTMGRAAGLPEYVRVQATDRYRDALEAGLAGGRMCYESLAAGAVVVAAREAGIPQSIDDLIFRARTPHERACAGARKVRLGLDLVRETPPTRPGAVEDVVAEVVARGFRPDELMGFLNLTRRLMRVADKHKIGPGTPRATVAGAAAYQAARQLGSRPQGGGLTSRDVAAAVQTIVDSSRNKIQKYHREIKRAAE